ncbi:aldehyde dehydrogenase family protein [Fulvivirga lutea]|uniref:Aldehyde dehydrogenase n=1 Tax=Fulvivirga lutea TaxID=2810512 RepID=A0A974WHY1_9BACT|nr:aldehyde dehydrogenase family protein [Fulvivirga lutea]QSE98224.1 aldehyde dehydrogenase family protein [Fulvivirga lutea]
MIEQPIQQQSVQQSFDFVKSGAIKTRKEPIGERKKRLKLMLQWISKNESKIKAAVYQDFKKPASEVDISEIYPVTSEIKHALESLTSWAKPKKIDAPLSLLGTTSHIQYEPKGACLIIAPWNYPFSLAIGPLVSCLAAGNTAVIKPSEMTPNTSILIEEMISDLFDKEIVSVINGGVEVSQELLALPFDHIFFTGSPQVGKVVMKAAAENLTSVTLELGGKSPVIVDERTDISDAAEKIAWGKYLNNGQTCIAPDYALVHENIKDKFEEKLTTKVKELFSADETKIQDSPDYGRIVNAKHYARLTSLIDEAVSTGAEILFGGDANSDDNFIPPMALTNVSMNSRMMEEEIFGPVLPIISYNNLEEAIGIINSKPKPLALYYFGRSSKNRKKVLKETSSGNVCINDCVIHFGHANLPFGGVNNSGIGKAHGYYGFLAFSNEKGVLKQRIGLTSTKSIYPPYSNFKKLVIRILKKYL